MTTLTGDKCPTCGYAFEVFDHACPRCYTANTGAMPLKAPRSAGISERTLQFLGHLAFWMSLAIGVASVSCVCVLRVFAHL